jgi:hypothetical protein
LECSSSGFSHSAGIFDADPNCLVDGDLIDSLHMGISRCKLRININQKTENKKHVQTGEKLSFNREESLSESDFWRPAQLETMVVQSQHDSRHPNQTCFDDFGP